MPEETRVPPIAGPLASDKRDPVVLSASGHPPSSNPHQGSPQRSSGRGLERSPYLDGVDAGYDHLPVPLLPSGKTSDRPLCHQGKSAASVVHVTMPGHTSSGDGCSTTGLVQLGVDISVSSLPASERSDPETPGLSRHGVPDSPLLAHPSLVSFLDDEVPSSHEFEGFSSDSDDGGGDSDLSSHGDVQTNRLAVVESGYLDLNCSADVRNILLNKHSRSTKHQYETAWRKFLRFLQMRDIPLDKVEIGSVLEFLTYEHKNYNREFKTIASYKNALRDPLWSARGLNLDSQLVNDFMGGLRRAKPPRRAAPMPSWELNDLLRHLRSSAFEPLERADTSHLIQKVGILILLATGRRLGEIANFTEKVVVEEGRWVFNWPMTYTTKNERNSWRSSLPSIETLKHSDRNLCPVRAVRIYLDRKDSITPSTSMKGMFWPMPQTALSNLLVRAIKDSVSRAGKEVPDDIGCHQIRKLSVSLSFNEFKSVRSKSDLLPRRVGSKSMTVLKRFYITSVPKPKYKISLPLGTLQ